MVDDKYEYYRKRIVRNRCKACHPCPMGVTGCAIDTVPHGHGGAQICPECDAAYYRIHPHSEVCSKRTPVYDTVVHDPYHMKHQLDWRKDWGEWKLRMEKR